MADRIFMIDAHHRAVAAQRDIADIIIVIAELLCLCFGRLAQRIECGRAGQDRIAPTDHDLHLMSLGDMMRFIDTVADFFKGEGFHRR